MVTEDQVRTGRLLDVLDVLAFERTLFAGEFNFGELGVFGAEFGRGGWCWGFLCRSCSFFGG